MLRNLAEQENIRRRAQTDLDNSKSFAIQKFAKGLLDVTDNLQWALTATKEKAETGENEDLKTFYDGVVLTETTLHSVLTNNGMTKMDSLGKKFDPNLHDGLFMYEDDTKEVGTVGQILKEGWLLKERVIRPANVGTIKAPEAPKEESTEEAPKA